MMKQLQLFPSIFLFCISTLLSAQNEEWFVYDTTNSELRSMDVYFIEIDESNTKWIGSASHISMGWDMIGTGLTKFNDSEWIHFDTLNSGLPSNSVVDMAIDSEGYKWIATRIHYNHESPYTWFENQGGLTKFDGNTSWTVYNTSNSDIPTNDLSCITIDDSNIKWIGTWEKGLVKFDGTNWTVYNTSNSELPDNRINCITVDSDTLWIGTEKGLATFDGNNSWTVYNTSNSDLPVNNVMCISFNKSGNKWIGTRYGDYGGGLLGYLVAYPEEYPYPITGAVNCIEIDKFENIWVGFNNDGIRKLDTTYTFYENIAEYTESNSGLPSDWIITLASDQLGNMWIGTDGGGLAVFNENGIVSVDENHTSYKNIPDDYKLNQNYPNPFNPTTKINYELPTTITVDLSIYNLLGQKVATLVSEKQNVGSHQVEWNALGFASGIYYYRIEAGEFVDVRKMILLR